MSDPALLSEFRTMALHIAPELQAGGLYVIDQPATWAAPINCNAYCFALVPDFVRNFLMAQGNWQGFAPGIVFVEPPSDDDESRGTFLHELAHGVPVLPAPRPDYKASVLTLAFENQVFATFAKGEPPAERWAHHDHRFIRRALHLHARAVDAGWAVRFSSLGAGGIKYALGSILEYREALGDEPWRLRSADFDTIEATPSPAAFAALWERDQRRYHEAAQNPLREIA